MDEVHPASKSTVANELSPTNELNGVWDVERVSGFLPPLVGVRKRIEGDRGATTVAGLSASFDVVGRELRYRWPFEGLVDAIEPGAGGSWEGRTSFRGNEYARFRLTSVPEAPVSSVNDQLVKHIEEAIEMEQDVKRMLDGMIQTQEDPQVTDLLEHHRAQTEQHAQRLRRRLEAHGESPSMLREVVGIVGSLVKLPLDMLLDQAARGDTPGRHARDAYATEHMEIAAYRLLERIAERSGDAETAHVARQNRAEEEAMARKLDELWDLFAEQSLREETSAR